MLSISPSSVTPSSLELMLENLCRNEEEDIRDLPPALPARPRPYSKARRPSTKRPLPPNLDSSDALRESSVKNTSNRETKDVRISKPDLFGANKRIKQLESDSPYVMVSNAKGNNALRSAMDEYANTSTQPSNSKDPNWDDKVGYFIREKLHVWCRFQNGQWRQGQIQSTLGDEISILLLDGTMVSISTEELLPANPDLLDGADDLMQLIFLNEPSVIHNLCYRYARNIIYTKAGPVLIAINPFKEVPLYGNDLVTAYKEKFVDVPHVYAVTNAAYTEMIRDELNQSIIISGESGAGKTETAKVAVQFLASHGGSCGEIERGILLTSCILEAFGNAKTLNHDNSSRLANLIEIHFNAVGKICGSNVQTFLFDKSRVVQRALGERSFHIFYQLCAGAPPILKDKLKLKRACEYNYINQSNCLEIDAVDDAKKFHELMDALNVANICNEKQEHVLKMLAAVLWLGNISFQVTDNENHVDVVVDEALSNTASLLGCSVQDLVFTLANCRVQTKKDKFATMLTLQQGVENRDSLAKFLYGNLFDWLVEELNKLLTVGERCSGRSISILDICGFGSFQNNSFEQLCINYANERLEQHLVRHLLKLVQEEYELDGIDWSKLPFEDNQDCLDLFEKRYSGLISLLEEELNFPEATGLTFSNKLKQSLNSNPCFSGGGNGTFSIHHYAGEVLYDTNCFLEKSRDPMYCDMIKLLSSCSGELSQLCSLNLLNQSPQRETLSSQLEKVDQQKLGVLTKLKIWLFKLMQQLEDTNPHFIRCIKPNTKQLPGKYEPDLVLSQLRCSRLLDVLRISRSKYATKMTHQEFMRRYGFMLLKDNECQDPLSISVAVLQQLNILPELYQVGCTKLYFRGGQIDLLENARNRALQGMFELKKGFHHHNFHELKGAVTTLQSFVRGENARGEFEILKYLMEQVTYKMHEVQIKAVVQIQSVIRGWLARKHFRSLQNLKRSDSKQKGSNVPDTKDLAKDASQVFPSIMEELQRQVLMAEATLRQKEAENIMLRRQLQQFEVQLSKYKAKKKKSVEMWRDQGNSIATNRGPAASSTLNPPGRLCGSPLVHYYCSEDTSMGTQTGGSTPMKFSNDDLDVGRQIANGTLNPVSCLATEFDQWKQNFDDDLKSLEVKSGQHPSFSPAEELKRVKNKFKMWKKEYKVRLRQAKAKLHRNGYSEGERGLRKWWGKKSSI